MGSKVINISLPESLLSMIDSVANKESRTRSEFFREAARRYIEEFLQRMSNFPAGHKFTISELRQMLEAERSGGRGKITMKARRAIRRVKRSMRHKKTATENLRDETTE